MAFPVAGVPIWCRARGEIEVNGIAAPERAGIRVAGEETITIKAVTDTEIVLVDIA